MLGSFKAVAPYLKFNPKKVAIDNAVFKLHYRWTFSILIVATILVTSRQYIGEHIKCISDTISQKVVETFCFFNTTFTVAKLMNESAVQNGDIPHPGVGPYQAGDELQHHAYYQWVPFVLFGQALMFYLPHLLWKSWEQKRIYNLVNGLKMIGITRHLKNKAMTIGGRDIPSLIETDSRVNDIKDSFKNRLKCNEMWGGKLVLCEVLNLANIILQIYITDKFLGGQFLRLGVYFLREDWKGPMDNLDIIFPKVTKCEFKKFGPGGSIQYHDTLCVMALNIINEKIYAFLWFWFLFVLIASTLAVIWRLITLCSFKNLKFNQMIFKYASPSAGRLDPHTLQLVLDQCNFANWMFLYFLASNMAGFLFRKVLEMIVYDFNLKPRGIDEAGDNEANKRKMMAIDEVDSVLIPKEKLK